MVANPQSKEPTVTTTLMEVAMTLLKPSLHLVALVQHFEGLHLSAYLDVAGVKTIGYGHTGTDFALSDTWTEEQCENALRRDLAFACAAVDNLVKVELTQWQYDALADFCYNVGAGKLAGLNISDRNCSEPASPCSTQFSPPSS